MAEAKSCFFFKNVMRKETLMSQNTWNGFSSEMRETRLKTLVDDSSIVSARTYNAALTLTVLYGLIVNVLLCRESVFRYVFSHIPFYGFIAIYFVSCIAGIIISRKAQTAAPAFLGYNLIVVPAGLLVSAVVYMGGYSPLIVHQAFLYTAGVTVIMTTAGILFPELFSKIGSILFFGLLGVLVAGIFSIFFPAVSLGVSMFAAVLFSLYIGYDVYRSQQFPRTIKNAIFCAIDIYLDIINLFLRILEILGRKRK
jgi:FtsH-binding integral membrane protein